MYLDPGFGSMIIQVIVAAVAAGGAYLYIARKKIKEFFARKKGGAVASVENEAGSNDPGSEE